MSHIAEIAVQFKDMDCLRRAAASCGAEVIGEGEHRLFGASVKGFAVKLKDWQYSVVIQDGKVSFDNFRGLWGKIEGLNALRQRYAVEVAKKAARQKGMSVREVKQANGTVRLVCQGGGR